MTPTYKGRRGNFSLSVSHGKNNDNTQSQEYKAAKARKQRAKMKDHNRKQKKLNKHWGKRR